jgi:hypothetical protein
MKNKHINGVLVGDFSSFMTNPCESLCGSLAGFWSSAGYMHTHLREEEDCWWWSVHLYLGLDGVNEEKRVLTPFYVFALSVHHT